MPGCANTFHWVSSYRERLSCCPFSDSPIQNLAPNFKLCAISRIGSIDKIIFTSKITSRKCIICDTISVATHISIILITVYNTVSFLGRGRGLQHHLQITSPYRTSPLPSSAPLKSSHYASAQSQSHAVKRTHPEAVPKWNGTRKCLMSHCISSFPVPCIQTHASRSQGCPQVEWNQEMQWRIQDFVYGGAQVSARRARAKIFARPHPLRLTTPTTPFVLNAIGQ